MENCGSRRSLQHMAPFLREFYDFNTKTYRDFSLSTKISRSKINPSGFFKSGF